jgi:hypothetical protein
MTEGKPPQAVLAQRPEDRMPGWVPRWLSERERAAIILAAGIVLAAVILAIGIANMHPGGPPARQTTTASGTPR